MNFVTRAQWGARAPRSITPLPNVDAIVYHYSAADSDETVHGACDDRVRGIQRYHMDSQHWNDIAYNFLVCRHGYVYEGRGYQNMSAATYGANGHTLAVCFLGNDDDGRDDVTPAGRDAFVAIAKEIERVRGHQMLYRGHRDYTATSCPGNEIYTFVRSSAFAEAVRQRGRLPGPSPKPAWFWAWADWRLGGRKTPRPSSAPRVIPMWAWLALREWQRRHP